MAERFVLAQRGRQAPTLSLPQPAQRLILARRVWASRGGREWGLAVERVAGRRAAEASDAAEHPTLTSRQWAASVGRSRQLARR